MSRGSSTVSKYIENLPIRNPMKCKDDSEVIHRKPKKYDGPWSWTTWKGTSLIDIMVSESFWNDHDDINKFEWFAWKRRKRFVCMNCGPKLLYLKFTKSYSQKNANILDTYLFLSFSEFFASTSWCHWKGFVWKMAPFTNAESVVSGRDSHSGQFQNPIK